MKVTSAAGIAAAAQNNHALGAAAGKQRRQVVILCGESVRYDMLNCNRQTGLKTPNLDRLAAQGTRFERAYNCQPVCSPARSSLWTGLYPHTNGVWGNSMPLGDTTHTLGQRLTDRGVHCAFMGKWHLTGTDYFDTGRVPNGWDPNYWYDMRDYLNELSPEDRLRSRDPDTAKDPSWTADMCYAHRCTNRAVDFLSKHYLEDFLLIVAYDEPHDPSLCPIEYSEMYKNYVFPRSPNVDEDLSGKPVEQKIWAGKRTSDRLPSKPRPQYFGSHTFVDHEIGRVLDQIEARTPDALVIYTADHGVFLDSHHLTDKGPAMYDEITHIPFLVKWPKHTPEASASTSLVSHVDLAGTIMEFFGFEVPKTLEGVSQLSVFKNPQESVRKEVFIEWGRYEVDHDGFGGYQPIRCICDGRYKLSINLMVTDELYDLQDDPSELKNLIDSKEHAAIRNNLHDRLLNQMNVSRDPFRGYYWGRRAWRPEFPETWENDGMTRQRESDGYLQDDWRATHSLTLNLGLRYDYVQPIRENAGRQANFLPNPVGPGSGTGTYVIPSQQRTATLFPNFTNLLAKDNIALQYSDNPFLIQAQKVNFAPRVGLAYSVDSKTVLRAGFGIFFGGLENRGGATNLGNNYPFQFTSSFPAPSCGPGVCNCRSNGMTLENGFSAALAA